MEKGLWCWCSVLWLSLLLTEGVLSSEHANKSCTSSCGIITNISYPFRLRDDPPYCGHHKHELACENNITLLHLHDARDPYLGIDGRYRVVGRDEVVGTYRVVGINYNNYTIRLVDAGIQKGNCSSLPCYSLSPSNFISSKYYQDSSNLYDTETLSNNRTDYIDLVKQVGYLNCSNPVRDDTAYVDTAPCVNWESKGGGHLYAVVGDLLAHQFKPQCRLKLVTLTAQDWKSLVPGGIKSYTDIHTLLSSGFELSWLPRLCADRNCPNHTYCDFTPESQSPQCVPQERCVSPWNTSFQLRDFGVSGVKSQARRSVNPMSGFGYSSSLLLSVSHYELLDLSQCFWHSKLFVVIPTLAIVDFVKFCYDFVHGIIKGLLRIVNMYVDDKTHYDFGPSKLLIKLGKVKEDLALVYKGKLRSGLEVAIKMLGFCVEGTKRALLYEFMPNGSLDKYIFSKEGSISLSYRKIHEISLGIAHGIAYLHHGCDMQILHFDIKPHNILLDENFNPKISDFGLARLYSIDDSIVTLTAARGTIGYMAPELFYKNIGGVSYKADVYSFGMLLMEMASQRRNLNPHVEHSSQLYFPLWIYDQFDEEKDIEMQDFSKEDKDLAKKMFMVALWCIQLKPADRPSMGKVIEMLETDDVESLEMPPKPSLYPNEEVLVDDGSYSSATSTISVHSHSSQGECIS
ncbi:hypothetical protein K1719_036277 [Acacia pycnantha]|nr:hypothetical protein K1719_036277 [Acacia pycnantha]